MKKSQKIFNGQIFLYRMIEFRTTKLKLPLILENTLTKYFHGSEKEEEKTIA